MLKMRAAKQKIGRSLADLGAIHQETKVICFNMFSTGFETMIHARLQADLVTTAAGGYTDLHVVFSLSRLIHGVLLK